MKVMIQNGFLISITSGLLPRPSMSRSSRRIILALVLWVPREYVIKVVQKSIHLFANRVRYVIWIVIHSQIIGIRHITVPAMTIFHISATGYSPIRKIRKPQMIRMPPNRVKSAVAKLTASMQVYWIRVRAIITRSSTALMSSLSGQRIIFNIVRRIFIAHLFLSRMDDWKQDF